MGVASAQGILGGTFQTSGTFRAYFKDSGQYDLFTAETAGRLAYVMKDNTGNACAFTFMNAILVAGAPNIGGPGQPIYATFTVEGGPQVGTGNSTFSIDRWRASDEVGGRVGSFARPPMEPVSSCGVASAATVRRTLAPRSSHTSGLTFSR